MDESDPLISFDDKGVCHHCRTFDSIIKPNWHPDQQGADLWQEAAARLRTNPTKDGYDCLIGLSGGLDSSQMVMLAHQVGLNPLIVHVDAGWNSELAVNNIERVLDATGFDLETVVVNWESMRRLQLAYLRAGVINQDVPQDHAFTAGLISVAKKFGIRDVINGHNIATESVLPISWGFFPMDTQNLKAIHRKFGDEGGLEGYPLVSMATWIRANSPKPPLRFIKPLDWLPYDRDGAEEQLQKVGWRPYPRKHGESRFTVFYQEFILPTRFNVDKRRAHYSSLILAEQLDRQAAISLLREPMYDEIRLSIERDFFCRKLRISEAEFEELMTQPIRSHTELPSLTAKIKPLRKIMGSFKRPQSHD